MYWQLSLSIWTMCSERTGSVKINIELWITWMDNQDVPTTFTSNNERNFMCLTLEGLIHYCCLWLHFHSVNSSLYVHNYTSHLSHIHGDSLQSGRAITIYFFPHIIHMKYENINIQLTLTNLAVVASVYRQNPVTTVLVNRGNEDWRIHIPIIQHHIDRNSYIGTYIELLQSLAVTPLERGKNKLPNTLHMSLLTALCQSITCHFLLLSI